MDNLSPQGPDLLRHTCGMAIRDMISKECGEFALAAINAVEALPDRCTEKQYNGDDDAGPACENSPWCLIATPELLDDSVDVGRKAGNILPHRHRERIKARLKACETSLFIEFDFVIDCHKNDRGPVPLIRPAVTWLAPAPFGGREPKGLAA